MRLKTLLQSMHHVHKNLEFICFFWKIIRTFLWIQYSYPSNFAQDIYSGLKIIFLLPKIKTFIPITNTGYLCCHFLVWNIKLPNSSRARRKVQQAGQLCYFRMFTTMGFSRKVLLQHPLFISMCSQLSSFSKKIEKEWFMQLRK